MTTTQLNVNNLSATDFNVTLTKEFSNQVVETSFLKSKSSKTFSVAPGVYMVKFNYFQNTLKENVLRMEAPGTYDVDFDVTGNDVVIVNPSKYIFLTFP